MPLSLAWWGLMTCHRSAPLPGFAQCIQNNTRQGHFFVVLCCVLFYFSFRYLRILCTLEIQISILTVKIKYIFSTSAFSNMQSNLHHKFNLGKLARVLLVHVGLYLDQFLCHMIAGINDLWQLFH
jgi:hypothetical protein